MSPVSQKQKIRGLRDKVRSGPLAEIHGRRSTITGSEPAIFRTGFAVPLAFKPVRMKTRPTSHIAPIYSPLAG
ncbi:hypothetical protein GGD66_002959 [Bradyrhizobium sp. CIR48]|nr:hypothetical protein [Bradyrhizobium sp. CIR48]